MLFGHVCRRISRGYAERGPTRKFLQQSLTLFQYFILLSAMLALFFTARGVEQYLSLVDHAPLTITSNSGYPQHRRSSLLIMV